MWGIAIMNQFWDYMQMSILGSIPQSFVYILFVMSFLQPEPAKLYRRVALLVVIHSLYTDTMQLILPFSYHLINSIFMQVVLIWVIFRELSHKKKLLTLLAIDVFYIAMDLVSTSIAEYVLDIKSRENMILDQLYTYLPIIYAQTVFILMLTFIIRSNKFKNVRIHLSRYFSTLIQSGRGRLSVLVLLIAAQFALLGTLKFIQYSNESHKEMKIAIIIYAVIAISLVALVLVAQLIIRTREHAVQTTQDHYIEDINRMFASIRGQRHDFINHLQVIHTMAQMNKTTELQSYVADLVHETQEMSEIVNHTSPALAAFVKAKATVAIAKGIAFTFELPPQKLEQESSIRTIDIIKILGNLVDNAFDEVSSMPAGKRFVQGSIKSINQRMVLEVANRGRVLSCDEQANIFKAGFTTKTSGKHSGLGLAIVSERTEHYGGKLELLSDEENGTVFRITIPQQEAAAG